MACMPATPRLCPEALGAMHCKGRALGMFDGILQRWAWGEAYLHALDDVLPAEAPCIQLCTADSKEYLQGPAKTTFGS